MARSYRIDNSGCRSGFAVAVTGGSRIRSATNGPLSGRCSREGRGSLGGPSFGVGLTRLHAIRTDDEGRQLVGKKQLWCLLPQAPSSFA